MASEPKSTRSTNAHATGHPPTLAGTVADHDRPTVRHDHDHWTGPRAPRSTRCPRSLDTNARTSRARRRAHARATSHTRAQTRTRIGTATGTAHVHAGARARLVSKRPAKADAAEGGGRTAGRRQQGPSGVEPPMCGHTLKSEDIDRLEPFYGR